MQSVPSPPVTASVTTTRTKLGSAFWIILLGGLVVATGVVLESALTLALALGYLPGFPQDYRWWLAYDDVGYALEAAGFLVAFLGIALGLRGPTPVERRAAGPRAVGMILLGGLLVAVPMVVLQAWNIGATLGPPPYFGTWGLWPVEASILLQAAGFLLAFLGIALAFRARPAGNALA